MLIFINHDDLRSLELMEECIRRGYYVSDSIKDIKYADVIYLGGKGIDRKNHLLLNKDTILFDENIFKSLKKHCLVLTLVENEYMYELSHLYHFQYVPLLKREEFLIKNSLLTAEGLISYLISHRRFPLFQSHILVLGYGHCAKPIARYLKAMGAVVCVAVRREELKKDIVDEGYEYMYLQDLNLQNFDILINTIPSLIVQKEHIDQAQKHLMMVDIASYPYGIDHHYALSQGFNSIILPSIPSQYAYGYAGQMIIDEVERMLEN